MSGDIIAASPARRRGARAQLAGMAGAVAAAVAVWLIARYGAGMQLRTPGVGPGQRPASLAVGLAAAESAVISVAAWGLPGSSSGLPAVRGASGSPWACSSWWCH
jgi:hypothetical protein